MILRIVQKLHKTQNTKHNDTDTKIKKQIRSKKHNDFKECRNTVYENSPKKELNKKVLNVTVCEDSMTNGIDSRGVSSKNVKTNMVPRRKI